MRIFVTGATGVIGRHVVPMLIEQGHDVTAVGRSEAKREQLARLGARPIALDLFDGAAVTRAVRDMNAICNLATAIPKGARAFFPWPWRETTRIRRTASANLAAAALASNTVERFIQESFAPVYRDGGDAWIDETSPVQPARYNRSVLDAERQAESVARAGRAGVVLRFGLFYGSDDPFTMQLLQMVKRGLFPLPRREAFAPFISHEDAARAVVAALEVPSGIYNAVDEPMRRGDLASGLAAALGVRPPRILPAWTARLFGVVGPTLARSLRISNRKLRESGRWTPRYPTALDGLAAIAARAKARAGAAARADPTR